MRNGNTGGKYSSRLIVAGQRLYQYEPLATQSRSRLANMATFKIATDHRVGRLSLRLTESFATALFKSAVAQLVLSSRTEPPSC